MLCLRTLRVTTLFITSILLLSGCNDIMDDLNPSGQDQRDTYNASSIGSHPGETAPDFAVYDTLDNPFLLSAELASTDAIVLYFNMWCPICDSHMSHMRSQVIPNYSNVRFYFVDYVSAITSVSRSAQLSNGYGTSDILVDDINHTVTDLYNATMGTTIVINTGGIVLMNEDYKDGSKLIDSLNNL